MAISRDAQPALALQRLEEDEVQNMEEKEHMITRDGELAAMMQHQDEDKAHKWTEKEQRAYHDINANKEGFDSRSACPFLAPFSSVVHTPRTWASPQK